MRKGESLAQLKALRLANADLKARHLLEAQPGHKCKTQLFRQCPTCQTFTCKLFVKGECSLCSERKPWQKVKQKERTRAWYLRNKERHLILTKERKARSKRHYYDLYLAWRKNNSSLVRYYSLVSFYKTKGREVPMVWLCLDCGRLTAENCKKLDAYCRGCKGIHVREMKRKTPTPALTSG